MKVKAQARAISSDYERTNAMIIEVRILKLQTNKHCNMIDNKEFYCFTVYRYR